MSAETVPTAVRIHAQLSVQTVLSWPGPEGGVGVIHGSLLRTRGGTELLERLLCSRLPAGHSRWLCGRGTTVGPVGQAPSACGHSCQEGLPDTAGGLCAPHSQTQQHLRGARGSEQQRGSLPGLPTPLPVLSPAGPDGGVLCSLLISSWPFVSAPSSRPRGLGSFVSAHGRRPGEDASVGSGVADPRWAASSLGRGLGWALPLSLDPEPARGGPPWPGTELKATWGPGSWEPGQRQSPPSGPKAPSPGNPPPGLSCKLPAAPWVGRAGGRRVLVMLRGPHTLSPPLLSCLAFGPL